MIRIYLASSWKNKDTVNCIAGVLRHFNFEVDSFCEETGKRFSFHFSEVEGHETMDAIDFLKTDFAQKAFHEDRKWLDWADVVVMVKPCGNSAHLEAGYARGQGKKLYIYGEFKTGDFDVMYGFADGMFDEDVNASLFAMANKIKDDFKLSEGE